MWICWYVCIYGYICMCIYTYICIYLYIQMQTYVYIYACVYVQPYEYSLDLKCICRYIYMYTYIHAYMQVYWRKWLAKKKMRIMWRAQSVSGKTCVNARMYRYIFMYS
jgi:hypothetical protein